MIVRSRGWFESASMVALLILVLGSQGRADSAAVTLTPDSNNTFNNGLGPFSLGYEFLANTDMTVTQLGYFVDTPLTETHDVGLYDATTMTLLASTTITSADTPIDFFAYGAIAPVTLTAGQDYVIVGTSGIEDPYTFDPLAFSTAPNVTFIQDGFVPANGLKFPDFFGDGTIGFFGPNFMFKSSTSIPEPSTMVLGSLAVVGGLLTAWRRRLSRVV